MQKTITIRLLGQFELCHDGGPPIILPSKAQTLVAYLALHGGAVRRETLCAMFWPDRGEEQARHSLRQTLFVLRRDGFGGLAAIKARDEALTLLASHVSCDTHALRDLVGAAPNGSWRDLVDCYRGAVLQDFPPASPEFDDFVRAMRRTVESDVLTALARFADAAIAQEDNEQALAIAEQMWAIDPLREDTHRLLIERYTACGRQADAVRIYTEAKQLLRREIGADPAVETEALMARIRSPAGPVARPVDRVEPRPSGRCGPPRIAVLPLRESGEHRLPAHVSDGLTSDVITQLAGLRELAVISHGSTIGLRDPAMEPQAIGRLLNASYLVMTRVRRGGDRLRLTTELTDAASGEIIFARTDDTSTELTFEDQDRIVARLVNVLVPQVREAELRRIRGQRPQILSVYDKILLSREQIMMVNRDGLREVRGLLDQVMEQDPGYGEAYALAADWHGIMVGEYWSADRAADIAAIEQYSKAALRLDSCNLRALVSYGYRRAINHRDSDSAMRMFQQALDVAPSAANAWALSGLCCAFAGDASEAVMRATRAMELSPFDREAYKFQHALCVAHYTNGDFESAAAHGLQALEETPAWRATMTFTAASLAALGRGGDAREVVARFSARWKPRRVADVVASVAYRDVARRSALADHLRAAGYPD